MLRNLSPKPDHRFWPLLFFGLFLILFVAELLEESMFIDGVWYAVISKNLANGIGSFWQPQFSSTIFSAFHEHPPLVFGIQSLFFDLFGDHFLTERLFSAIMYILLALMIVALWRKAIPEVFSYRYLLFLPLIIWQANLVNYYFLPANLLDTPLAILAALSIYLLWESASSKSPLVYLVLAGITLGVSVLTKGVTGLFPLAFLIFHWIIFKPYDWKNVVVRSLMVGASLTLFFTILFLWIPSSLESLNNYLDVQLLASLNGERKLYYYQTNRFFIIGQLLWALAPMLFFLFVVKLAEKLLKIRQQVKSPLHNKTVLLFILIGLSASLPIMISPRQALPYLIPSLPYFSLAAGVWAAPKIESLFKQLYKFPFPFIKTAETGAIILCALGCLMISKNYGLSNERDANVIRDAKIIGHIAGQQKTISSTTYNMYISGYLMRFHNISIDTTHQNRPYLITKKEDPFNSLEYEKLNVKTYEYAIYRKKSVLSEQK